MGMPLELNWVIVDKGNQQEVHGMENHYSLIKEGYRLYPLDIPVKVYKTLDAMPTGEAIIKEVMMVDGKTKIVYEVIALTNVN